MNDQPYIGTDEGHHRETLRMLHAAVKNRWKVPDAMKEIGPKVAAKIAVEGKTERERLRAVEVLAAFDRDNIAALLHLDKIERLDTEQPTERQKIEVVYIDRIDDKG